MSELSDYKRCIEAPNNAAYEKRIRTLQARLSVTEAMCERLGEALKVADEGLDWMALSSSYVRIHGTGLQPPPKTGTPQIEKIALGETRAILLNIHQHVQPAVNAVSEALTAYENRKKEVGV